MAKPRIDIENGSEDFPIITHQEPLSALSEQYRKLRTNIDYSTYDKDIKVINVTSALQGEGKTITALNLATVYSQADTKTLLIDMDLRKPKVHRGFNISNNAGLTQVITEDLPLEKALYKPSETLHVLPTGGKLPFPVEFLGSKKVHAFIESVRNDYDKIIIDCPPMTAVTDASVISKFSDGTLFIIGSRKTNVDVAQTIIKNLRDNGAFILGAVLTRVLRKDEKYVSGYYYYYSIYGDEDDA